jgi:hypothetical protein
VMDQSTGPPDAVTVRAPPLSGLRTIDRGATLSVPGGGGGGGGAGRLVDGAGEPGDGLWPGAGDRDGEREGLRPGAGDEAPGAGPAGGVLPPADGEGATRAAAVAVGPVPPG